MSYDLYELLCISVQDTKPLPTLKEELSKVAGVKKVIIDEIDTLRVSITFVRSYFLVLFNIDLNTKEIAKSLHDHLPLGVETIGDISETYTDSSAFGYMRFFNFNIT